MDESTISFLSNYISELRKQPLGIKGKAILRATEEILRREIKLREELEELRARRDDIKSMSRRKPLFFSHEPKVTDKRYEIEDLNKNRNRSINNILETATNLIIRTERR